MNEEISKKLIFIRVCIIVLGIILIFLFIFLIVKCNVFDFILNDRRYVREGGYSLPNDDKVDKKIDYDKENKNIQELISNENNKKNNKALETETNTKDKNKEIKIDNDSWWMTFKNVIDDIGSSIKDFRGIKRKDNIHIDKEIRNEDVIEVQNKFYELNLSNSNWHIIDIEGTGEGYNYYFNDKGKLLTDTITKDYKIVDNLGREIDDELEPIKYKVATVSNIYNIETVLDIKEPSKVLYSPITKLKQESTIYDNTMDRNMLNYVKYSNGFKKTTNGTIYNGSRWKGVSSLKDDGSKVIFYNPNNNFNKITGIIAHQEVLNNDNETRCTLYVYDKEHDNIHIDEALYSTDLFNYNEPYRFSFTFYRSIKELEFYIETEGDSKKRICYLKNLRFGFDKTAYREEIEEKKNEENYIKQLKELGIYYDTEEIDADKYVEYDYYLDDYDFIDYGDEELIENDYRTKEDKARDKVTGPAFDTELKGKKQIWEEGPAFSGSTLSEAN